MGVLTLIKFRTCHQLGVLTLTKLETCHQMGVLTLTKFKKLPPDGSFDAK